MDVQNERSYFDGGLLQLIGRTLPGSMIYSRKAKHTEFAD